MNARERREFFTGTEEGRGLMEEIGQVSRLQSAVSEAEEGEEAMPNPLQSLLVPSNIPVVERPPAIQISPRRREEVVRSGEAFIERTGGLSPRRGRELEVRGAVERAKSEPPRSESGLGTSVKTEE